MASVQKPFDGLLFCNSIMAAVHEWHMFVNVSQGNWLFSILIMLLNMFIWTENFKEH